MEPKQISLLPVMLVSLIGALGFSIVLPFLVFVVERFGGNGFIYGVVGATYPAFQFFGAPVLGRWSDRMGRRKVLLISQLGTFGSWVLFAIALYLPRISIADVSMPVVGDFELTLPLLMLFIARALDGLTGGNISVANAYVADVSTDENRSRNFGRMGVAFSIGMIGGPALASMLGLISTSATLPVLAATAISLVTAAVILLLLPESRPPTEAPPEKGCTAHHVVGVEHRDCHYAATAKQIEKSAPLGQRGVRYTLSLQFAILLAFNLYYAAFPVYAARNLGWSVRDVGFYFTMLAVLMVIVEGPILARAAKRVTESTLIVIGLAIMAAHFVYLMLVDGSAIYGSTVLFALGNGLMWPSVSSFLSGLASAETQGTVQGVAGSVSSLASIVGLLAGGVAFGLLGASIFGASGAIMFVAALLALRLRSFAKTQASAAS